MIRCPSTPRRLTLIIRDVAERAEDIEEVRTGPAARIAFDADGNLVNTIIHTREEELDDVGFNGILAYRVGGIFLFFGFLDARDLREHAEFRVVEVTQVAVLEDAVFLDAIED